MLNISQLVAGETSYNSLQGIAIVGTNLEHGTLQFSTNGGTSWTDVGTVSDSNALLLGDGSSDELRLAPTDAYIGDLDDAITFLAWDQESGTDGSYADTTTNGGTTAFSNTAAEATIGITPMVGPAISVGSDTAVIDGPPALVSAVDGQGTSVIAWNDIDHNLIAQFYNASGSAIGSPIQVNPTNDPVGDPTVSANANGTFAFAWNGNNGLEVQRYADTGGSIAAVDSSPLVLTSAADGIFFSVGVTANGGLVAGWSQPSTDGTQEQLEVQQFNSSGVASAGPTTVASINYDSYSFNNATMSVAADGSLAIAWSTASNADGSQYLQALQYNAAGVAQEDSPLDVASWSSDTWVTLPTISVDGSGGFIATWMQSDATTGNADLMAAHYDASGNTAGSILIDDNANGNFWGYSSNFPSQAVSCAGGNWGITWVNAVSGNLMGQFYNAQDEPLGDAFEIASSGTASFGSAFSLSSNVNGDLLAAWSTATPADASLTDNFSYFAQQLQLNQPPTVATMPAVTVVEGAASATIDLSSYFSDADIPYGDSLSFTASSSNTGVVGSSVSGNQLTLNYATSNTGSSVVTVQATDSTGNTVSTSFDVNVNPPAPTLTSSPVTAQLERSGGVLNMSQLVAGITTYNSQLGIAITGVDSSHGIVQYSTDGGTTWNDVGTVSNSNALLLANNSSTELQFIPIGGYTGSIADAITFQAWDQVTGTSGTYADATTNGGATAFSSDQANVALQITPLIGSAISVASDTADTDGAPALLTAVDGQGTSVVAWDDVYGNLFAQFYSASGAAIGSPVQVNPDGDSARPASISANASGTFAFAWNGSNGLEVQRILGQRRHDHGHRFQPLGADHRGRRWIP